MDSTTLLILIAVLIAAAVGVFLFVRNRPKPEEEFSHFRCPKCRRRLRYMERQVGHKGKCSNCGGSVIFPPIGQAID